MTEHASPSAADYDAAFERECLSDYPQIASLEDALGFRIPQDQMLEMARVLACPVKINPPNWQHGRVIYALLRDRIQRLRNSNEHVTCLDIGTAKGFSALCASMALRDAMQPGAVISVDVIDPDERTRRNTIAEVDGLKKLEEIVAPFGLQRAGRVSFLKSTGVAWLNGTQGRIYFAFVDGKHDASVVSIEGALIGSRQRQGDVILFDDVHLHSIGKAAQQIGRMFYDVTHWIDVTQNRAYLWGIRK